MQCCVVSDKVHVKTLRKFDKVMFRCEENVHGEIMNYWYMLAGAAWATELYFGDIKVLRFRGEMRVFIDCCNRFHGKS